MGTISVRSEMKISVLFSLIMFLTMSTHARMNKVNVFEPAHHLSYNGRIVFLKPRELRAWDWSDSSLQAENYIGTSEADSQMMERIRARLNRMS